MRQILIFAAVVFLGGIFVAKYADQAIGVHATAKSAATPQHAVHQPREPVSSGRSMMLGADRNGHFLVDARVSGRSINFVVDTGASLVALRESDAARFAPRPMPSDYTARVSTANGTIKGAPIKLDRIELGGITVFDVQGLILPDEALSQNLLGVSFLSRLKRYEYANGRMVLEQ